uniref:Uncharacterized protein n=1 Tax=Mustela putorius furo TaxID=9669 RepID=M3YB22_MUSPF
MASEQRLISGPQITKMGQAETQVPVTPLPAAAAAGPGEAASRVKGRELGAVTWPICGSPRAGDSSSSGQEADSPCSTRRRAGRGAQAGARAGAQAGARAGAQGRGRAGAHVTGPGEHGRAPGVPASAAQRTCHSRENPGFPGSPRREIPSLPKSRAEPGSGAHAHLSGEARRQRARCGRTGQSSGRGQGQARAGLLPESAQVAPRGSRAPRRPWHRGRRRRLLLGEPRPSTASERSAP